MSADCMILPAEEGFQANRSGESIDSNPYNVVREYTLWAMWQRGWNAAASESGEEETE